MAEESAPKRRARAGRIVAGLRRAYPDATCSLNFRRPLELLVATILSAQCTDERVNRVTPALFRKYRSAEDFANVAPEELMEDIRSTGFYRNKARAIQAACLGIVQQHSGQVPRTMEELTALAGVGRKTANVVLGAAFGQAVGIVVDTHVTRLAQRLGLTRQKDPARIEQDLMAVVDRGDWIFLAHAMILHGRGVCMARRPNCAACMLSDLCPSAPGLPPRGRRQRA